MVPAAVERRGTSRRKVDEACEDYLENIDGWHLDKKISLTHLLTTMAILGAGVGYVIQNEKNHTLSAARIDAMHAMIVELKDTNLRQDRQMGSSIERIEMLIQRTDDKLDRLLDKKSGRP